MEKIFNLTSTFKALDEDDSGVNITGYASTKDFDRAGDTIMPEAWTKGGLNNFEKNPIILFNHNYDKPIGRATGLKVTENGLEMKAKISKSAPENVATLVKEGILGAFSVGFRIKDADYLEETDGLKIKDAELFEVSVVSVPCNQAATFSLAKSFDSEAEYEDFKKTFKNSVDLAGQSLAKDEDSFEASDTPDGTEKSVQKEMTMSEVQTPEIDLEAFAKKVADETAAKIAIRQAEEKAAAEAEAKAAEEAEVAKAAQEEEVKQSIRTGIESGTERLLADVQKELNDRNADMEETLAQYKKELEEKSDEISKMRESKRVFADRSEKSDISKWGQDFMAAHMLGVMTRKGWETDFARDIQEKAGINYAANAADIDQEVSSQIEKEIMHELKVARLFREIPVNGGATVLPIQTDAGKAAFQTGAATSGNLENRPQVTANQYNAKQVTLNAYRLISSTFMDNDVDEQVLINLMPMLVESVARAHGRAVEDAILNGAGSITGLDGYAAASSTTLDISDADRLTAATLLGAREQMGKYGLMPSDVAYIVSQNSYFDLLNDANFQTLDEVGSDLAARVVGTIGAVYGSPVIVSEEFPAEAAGAPAAFAVNTRNYVVPRLRGVSVEQDYEVMNQRRVLVASQSLGFEEIIAGASGAEPSVKIDFVA
ncbi:MAG: HK97 family phage prohead protease [Bacteroidetes bacterium]|nr:MAG: HK97 family phage prohead protease [Bacteroidota bacterium]